MGGDFWGRGGRNPRFLHLSSCGNFHAPPNPLPNPLSRLVQSPPPPGSLPQHPCWLLSLNAQMLQVTHHILVASGAREVLQVTPLAPESRDQAWHFPALLQSPECSTEHHSVNFRRRVKYCSHWGIRCKKPPRLPFRNCALLPPAAAAPAGADILPALSPCGNCLG